MSIRYFLIVLSAAFLFQSCSDDDDQPKGKYESGAFVANEGVFGAGTGSITYYGNEGVAEQNIFKNAQGKFAGDVVQSVTFHDDLAFLVINADSKVEVANSSTFNSEFTITDDQLDKPRYIEVINNKAYISVWGAYDENFSLVDSYILVYDLTTKSIVKKIDTDEGTENLISDGNRLFASNFNYGSSSTVSVINTTDDSFGKNIELSAGPAGMVLDANNDLWVICVGGWGAETGELYRINTSSLEIEEHITITGLVGADIAVTSDKKNIVYSVGNSIYKLSITATEEATEELFVADNVTSLNALSVQPSSGQIWVADAPSFTDAGKVYIYTSDGSPVSSFETGIIPTQIVFK